MKIFVAFDNSFNVSSLLRFCQVRPISQVILFSLMSDYSFIQELENTLTQQLRISVIRINSAEMINQNMQNLRQEIIDWSYQLGEQKVRNKKIKEWLLLPGCSISAWWLSMLSEKDTVVVDAFFRMSQTNTIDQYLKSETIHFCLLSISNDLLRSSLKSIIKTLKIPLRFLKREKESLKKNFKKTLRKFSWLSALLFGFFNLAREIKKAFYAKRALSRYPRTQHSLLLVSPFPILEKEAAKQGVFRNKYMWALQDFFKKEKLSFAWLLLPADYDGYHFKDAVELARRFLQQGEKLFLIQEFINLRILMQTIFLWVRQIIVSSFLWHHVRKEKIYTPMITECYYPFIKSLWFLSFMDAVGSKNILNVQLFDEFFKKNPNIRAGIHYSEMHAWEKIFNALKPRGMKTIGFQHSAFCRNYLHYFYHAEETKRTGHITDLPLPTILAANGSLTYQLLSESHYSNLMALESARYLFIDEILSDSAPNLPVKPVLLMASAGGAMGQCETRSMIQLIHAAFPKTKNFEIWFKAHPMVDMREMFNQCGINFEQSGYRICYESISELIPKVTAVIVAGSTVAIEALAYGRDVIIPLFSDALLLSPLMDFQHGCYTISSPEQLKAMWLKIIQNETLTHIDQKRNFVRKYWYLDTDLHRWRVALTKISVMTEPELIGEKW